jgi:hypothetical protein
MADRSGPSASPVFRIFLSDRATERQYTVESILMKDILPTFLGIGAQRSGTSSIHQYLNQHPQVFLPSRKELRFFSHIQDEFHYSGPKDDRMRNDVVCSWPAYKTFFRNAGKYPARGEISPDYLSIADKAARYIRQYLPEARLFCVLRNPVDRAYSNFLYAIREGREPINDFRKALSREEERIRSGWSHFFRYKKTGLYAEQLAEYFLLFSREQIRVYRYDDLVATPLSMMRDVFHFLGVDPSFQPDVSLHYNASGTPRQAELFAFLKGVRMRLRPLDAVLPRRWRTILHGNIRDCVLRKPEPLAGDIRRELLFFYREDILRLQSMLQIDLSDWMKEETGNP